MTKKKKRRTSDIRMSVFSFACLLICWVGVTLTAFYLGCVLGRSDRNLVSTPAFPIYERVGESDRSSSFSFPKVLGDRRPSSQDPDLLDPQPRPLPMLQEKTGSTGGLPEAGGTAVEASAVKPEVSAPPAPSLSKMLIQVASFRDSMKAERLVGDLSRKGYRCFLMPPGDPDSQRPLYRVFVGPFTNRGMAEEIKEILQEKEGFKGIYIRKGTP
jgi:hypothetical protein